MSAGPLRIGTRGSKLARTQAAAVRDALAQVHPERGFEIVVVETTGDRDQTTPLAGMGGVGVFAAELRQALVGGEVDCAVHSLKDLPTEPAAGLTLAAICARGEPGDVLVARNGLGLAELPAGATVGTSSPRRRAWIEHRAPQVQVVELRGNVPTRVESVAAGKVDAVVLAAAGLARLGRLDEATERFDPAAPPAAPGQGAVAIEVRVDDPAADAVRPLHDAATAACVTAERACLAEIGGGCASKLGAYAWIEVGAGGALRIVAALPGSAGNWVEAIADGDAADAEAVGRAAAGRLREQGAITQ